MAAEVTQTAPPDYVGFAKAVVSHFGGEQHMELDCFDFQDLAEAFHVIQWEDYDPEKHGEIEAELGDRIWMPK